MRGHGWIAPEKAHPHTGRRVRSVEMQRTPERTQQILAYRRGQFLSIESAYTPLLFPRS
jgi:hypothetical protein